MSELSTGKPDGLTDLEHDAMQMTAALYNALVEIVSVHDEHTGQIPHTAVRDSDIGELAIKVHGIQHTIMAQAAARAHPTKMRLLGHMLRRGQVNDIPYGPPT